MRAFLISLSLGPVQEFVYTARRTRDLWFASTVLATASRAAASALVELGAELIFPATVTTVRDDRPDGRGGPGAREGVSNKILAELPPGKDWDPAAVAAAVRCAVNEHWRQIAEQARCRCEEMGVPVHEGRWLEQVEDVLELYAAWVPLDGDYAAAHARVERLLAGRKMIRDFRQAVGHAGVPKSSLDGAREAVIDPSGVPDSVLSRAGLKKREYLDAVGVIKRFGSRAAFVPVCRVAVDPWVRGLLECGQQDVAAALDRIKAAAKRLCSAGWISGVAHEAYECFPYEGESLFLSRLRELREELSVKAGCGGPGPDAGCDWGLLEAVDEIRAQLALIARLGYGEPSPYLAILLGDGDRMGAVISRLRSKEEHRRLSWCVGGFAQVADSIVRRHHGCLVFSGGDDVLAFVPVDTCIQAADDLRREFDRMVREAVGEDRPTFSVGIAIGHYLEPLGDLLGLARRAEALAKHPDRDALAVILKTRAGGDPLAVRMRWSDDPAGRLGRMVSMYLSGQLADRAGFHLRELVSDYSRMLRWHRPLRTTPLFVHDAVVKEARRVLRRKRTEEGQMLQEELVGLLLEGVSTLDDVSCLADRLLLARHLASAAGQSRCRLRPGHGRRAGREGGGVTPCVS